MSAAHTGGNAIPTIEREEHRSVKDVNGKAVVLYGYDYDLGELKPLATVQSTATPGIWGLVVLNADGSSLSTGSSSSPTAGVYGSAIYGTDTYA